MRCSPRMMQEHAGMANFFSRLLVALKFEVQLPVSQWIG